MLENQLIVGALFVALLFAVVLDDEPTEPEELTQRPTGDYVAKHEERLAGWMTVESFHVPVGCRVYIDEDVSLHARKRIVIEGNLILRDRTLNDVNADAPDLRMTSEGSIFVLGQIAGGKGRSFAGRKLEESAGQRGGDGSSIMIAAPVCSIHSRITGGWPGSSGPGTDGAHAGEILIYGDRATDDQLRAAGLDPEVLLYADAEFTFADGGAGGESLPGFRAGSGGNGGGGGWRPWSER